MNEYRLFGKKVSGRGGFFSPFPPPHPISPCPHWTRDFLFLFFVFFFKVAKQERLVAS